MFGFSSFGELPFAGIGAPAGPLVFGPLCIRAATGYTPGATRGSARSPGAITGAGHSPGPVAGTGRSPGAQTGAGSTPGPTIGKGGCC